MLWAEAGGAQGRRTAAVGRGPQAVRSGAHRGHKCGAELVKEGAKTSETPPERGSGLARF